MTVSKNKLMAILLVFAMTSSVSVYANGGRDGKDSIRETPDSPIDVKEITNKVKSCVGDTMVIRIIQSKDSKIVFAWGTADAEGGERAFTMCLNKETGVYLAMSRPRTDSIPQPCKPNRKMLKKMARAESMEHFAIFEKLKSCLATEAAGYRIIETKDKALFDKWLEMEMDKMKANKEEILLSFDEETKVWTAVLKPKLQIYNTLCIYNKFSKSFGNNPLGSLDETV